MLRRSVVLVLLSLLLGACAAPMRLTLTPEQRSKITELQARVIVVQDEVIAAVQPSQVSLATGGGLIGAMIDSSITNSRVQESQKIMGPFYASIEDVDYRQEFNSAMRQELTKYPIKMGEVVTTPRMLNQAELDRLLEKMKAGQSLLVIVPRYFFTMDFRNLDAEAVVTMWVKGDSATLVHRGVLYYQSEPAGNGGKASMNLWAANNAALFRSVLRESVTELSKLILLDVDIAAAPPKPGESKPYNFNTGVKDVEIKGRPQLETGNRVVLLGDDQRLYSLPKWQAAAVAQR